MGILFGSRVPGRDPSSRERDVILRRVRVFRPPVSRLCETRLEPGGRRAGVLAT